MNFDFFQVFCTHFKFRQSLIVCDSNNIIHHCGFYLVFAFTEMFCFQEFNVSSRDKYQGSNSPKSLTAEEGSIRIRALCGVIWNFRNLKPFYLVSSYTDNGLRFH